MTTRLYENETIKIHPTAVIDVTDTIIIGDFSTIGAHVTIRGKDVKLGRATWIDAFATVGGGRAELGCLEAGDFLHMGEHSFINTAQDVTIGHEVGLGRFTNLYTHGGYLSVWNGFPHQAGPIVLGDNVWLPKATVLPNVVIGSRVVVAAESLVNRDLPSCCLAGGIPARVIKENAYPLESVIGSEKRHRILGSVVISAVRDYGVTTDCKVIDDGNCLLVGDMDSGTMFFPTTRVIHGPATRDAERIKNLLRREGIRFRYYNKGGTYREWS